MPARDEALLDNPVYASLWAPTRALRAPTDARAAIRLTSHRFSGCLHRRRRRIGTTPRDSSSRAAPWRGLWRVSCGGGWRVDGFELVQMIGERVGGAECAEAIPLGAADVPEMLELVAQTEPGPFLRQDDRARRLPRDPPRGGTRGDGRRALSPRRLDRDQRCLHEAVDRGQGLAARLVGALWRASSFAPSARSCTFSPATRERSGCMRILASRAPNGEDRDRDARGAGRIPGLERRVGQLCRSPPPARGGAPRHEFAGKLRGPGGKSSGGCSILRRWLTVTPRIIRQYASRSRCSPRGNAARLLACERQKHELREERDRLVLDLARILASRALPNGSAWPRLSSASCSRAHATASI